jgi:hypothetical protein
MLLSHGLTGPDKIFQTDNRTLISTVTQLRTGHGYFNSHLSKIPTSNVEDTGCSCSGSPPQTPAHLILRCPQHAKARMVMRRETCRIPNLRLDLLLYTNMGAEALAKYLKTTKLATRRWKLGIDNKPANSDTVIGWAHSTSHRTNITMAPAGRQETRRRGQGTGRRRGAEGSGSAGDV